MAKADTSREFDRGDLGNELSTVVLRDKNGNIIHKGKDVVLLPPDMTVTANGKDYYDTTIYEKDENGSSESSEE